MSDGPLLHYAPIANVSSRRSVSILIAAIAAMAALVKVVWLSLLVLQTLPMWKTSNVHYENNLFSTLESLVELIVLVAIVFLVYRRSTSKPVIACCIIMAGLMLLGYLVEIFYVYPGLPGASTLKHFEWITQALYQTMWAANFAIPYAAGAFILHRCAD